MGKDTRNISQAHFNKAAGTQSTIGKLMDRNTQSRSMVPKPSRQSLLASLAEDQAVGVSLPRRFYLLFRLKGIRMSGSSRASPFFKRANVSENGEPGGEV